MGKTADFYKKNPEARKKKLAYDTKYQSSETQKKNRASRNRVRAKAMKRGIVKKGDGMDMHHHKGIKSDSAVKISASKNRGMPEKSRLKGSKRKKK